MSFIGWVILGGIAGWIASIITGRNNQRGCITNIVAGIVGAIVGGWVYSFIRDVDYLGFNHTPGISNSGGTNSQGTQCGRNRKPARCLRQRQDGSLLGGDRENISAGIYQQDGRTAI